MIVFDSNDAFWSVSYKLYLDALNGESLFSAQCFLLISIEASHVNTGSLYPSIMGDNP